MKGLYKDVYRKLMAASLTLSMVLSSPMAVGADTENQAKKDETVYIFTDPSGNRKEMLVNEHLSGEGSGAVEDDTTLEDIRNLKGDETFDENGEKITWDAEGEDIYYRGTTDKEAPVDIRISYYLNGVQVTADEIAGKSGKVTVRYDYVNKEKQMMKVGDKQQEVYVPFAVISAMILDKNKVSNVEISSGKVLEEGDRIITLGMAMPGLKESIGADSPEVDLDIPDSVEITMDASEFAVDMSMSVIANNLLSGIDFDDNGSLDDLKEDMETLTDSSTQLVEGTGELLDGITELDENIPEFADGMAELLDGIREYTDGVSQVKSGTDELKDGTGALVSGAGQLEAGAASAKSGADQLAAGYAGSSGAAKGAKDLAAGARQLNSGVRELSAGISSAAKGANDLKNGVSALSKGQRLPIAVRGSFIAALRSFGMAQEHLLRGSILW